MAIELRVIADEMLNGCANALALNTFDVRHGDARSEKRVFTKILEVSSVHRRAVNIDPGRQQEMDALSAGVATQLRADALSQRRVPGGREPDAPGHCCSRAEITNPYR